MQGGAAATARNGKGMDLRKVGLGAAVILLLGVVGYAVHHEMRAQSTAAPSAVPMTERRVVRPALTPEEEGYASALWKIHVPVKQDAVRMTYAGLAFKMKEISAQEMGARVKPLADNFHYAAAQMQLGLEPPASLRATHERYLAAIGLYEKAARIMQQAAAQPTDEKLIEAQTLSRQASEDLLRVADVLWPGEHKPN
jgi:hypothetical protein